MVTQRYQLLDGEDFDVEVQGGVWWNGANGGTSVSGLSGTDDLRLGTDRNVGDCDLPARHDAAQGKRSRGRAFVARIEDGAVGQRAFVMNGHRA